jgi:ribonuclease HI
MQNEIIMYTDGASRGNPGPGGYGVVLISGKHRLEKSEGFRLTTNNRMELLAVITGLEALKKPGNKVTVYTDSKYVADAVTKGWLLQWESKAFKKRKILISGKDFLMYIASIM